MPSEFLVRGNTIDIFCSEIAIGYESYLQDKHRAKAEGKPMTPAKYSTQDLQSMIDNVKSKGKKVGGKNNTK